LICVLGRVVVKDDADAKAAVAEAVVVRQGVADGARAHQRHVPLALHLEDAAQMFNQVGDLVAGALLAEFPEVGQVLANLGRADAQAFAQLAGGDFGLAIGQQARQGAQIYR
jgi:hypothetical protein